VHASEPERRAQERRWGWHRLADHWAARIVAEADIRPGELVVDIGAGEGALTEHLLAAGARVIAVELHPARRQRLLEQFAGQPVIVVNADAARLRLPSRPFRVVANPPYTVWRALLRTLLCRGSRLRSADLVLQRAVVRRYVEGRVPGAARWSLDYDARRGLVLPRSAFRPRAEVDSAVLRIRRRDY
jgi:23S rRNA (adenine-N6)-dimethyltransferase